MSITLEYALLYNTHMLTIHSNQLNSTFERIVRDKNGVLFRVRFIIESIDGRPQPKIVSAEVLIKNKDAVAYLPKEKSPRVIVEDKTPSFISFFSPFETLEFFMSQPTRAPSL